ncbi:MAG: rod-binding protein [Acetobacteraceae bacterium]|nr:rod-binding protein [Acetobacteraceae bacterium]
MTDTVSSPPTAAELSDPRTARIWKVAQDFEAMALGEMLKPMFKSVDTSQDPFGGGNAEATWRPMLIEEYAKGMERRGGIGLAAPVFRQLLHNQEHGR